MAESVNRAETGPGRSFPAPDLSIIVLVWNARDFAIKCLQSLVSHVAACSLEIIVVDNGSSDGIDTLIEQRFPGVHLIRNGRNLGFAAGNNIGIRKAVGRYLCLLNSDTEVLPGSLDALITFMDTHPKVGLCSPQGVNPDGTVRKSCKHFPTLRNQICSCLGLSRLFPNSRILNGRHMDYFDHLTTRNVDVLPGSFWMIRREALTEAGLLDEGFFFYGEDLDWCRRFHTCGWDVTFFVGAQFVHDHKGSSRRNPVFFHVQQYRSACRYWRIHHGWGVATAAHALMVVHEAGRLVARSMIFLVSPNHRGQYTIGIQCSWSALAYLLFGRIPDHPDGSHKQS